MLNAIIVLVKSVACVIRRVNIDAFNCSFEVFFKCAKRE